MLWPELVQGSLIQRENRFRARVSLAGAEASAHVANSGRLCELMVPGRAVWLTPVAGAGRKTAYDLALVACDGGLVSVDARLPNRLFAESLAPVWNGHAGEVDVAREARRGDSRLDFLLSAQGRRCWVEVKSVTLARQGTALFPDAPTARGARHLRELMAAVAAGDDAAIVFMVQRGDARRFAPHREADPAFASALAQAARAGVAVHAYRCQVDLEQIAVSQEIAVILDEE